MGVPRPCPRLDLLLHPPAPIRSASMDVHRDPSVGKWIVWQVGPFALLVISTWRFGFGYTFNFARPGAAVLIAAMVIYLIAVIAIPRWTSR